MVRLVQGTPTAFGGAIETIEMHTGGEPVRIVTSGYPPIPGATILDKRRYARDHLDHLRHMLMFEPRGHYDMYGVLPVEPDLADADLAVLFMHNEGYSTMCGHAAIALGRYAVDAGIVAPTAPETIVRLQCPCGMVVLRVAVEQTPTGYVTGPAAFESVPSFAFLLDGRADVPGVGAVPYDIGYGGAFYALVDAAAVGLDLAETPLDRLVDVADGITKHLAATVTLEHPDDADLAFLYGTILTDGGNGRAGRASRNVCVFAEREVDRSPTGSGVSARIAVQCARGLPMGEPCTFESLTGAVFSATPVRRDQVGHFDAVRVEVGGHAYYCGRSSFTVENGDPLGGGFLLR
ncbi:proline racemase family protein [Mesorhizobium marinum]|uniref:proline racemase family protein n=1 Tax=Mesorhizobium marinum TaxID=3228790 RepID=UPI003465D8C3